MTSISPMGRAAANMFIDSLPALDNGLQASMRGGATDYWSPGKLWDAAVLSMRSDFGYTKGFLESLKLVGSDVLAQLSPELRSQLDSRLRTMQEIFDEIHTDRGGHFAQRLLDQQAYLGKVAGELKDVLAVADAATAAKQVQAPVPLSAPTSTAWVDDVNQQLNQTAQSTQLDDFLNSLTPPATQPAPTAPAQQAQNATAATAGGLS